MRTTHLIRRLSIALLPWVCGTGLALASSSAQPILEVLADGAEFKINGAQIEMGQTKTLKKGAHEVVVTRGEAGMSLTVDGEVVAVPGGDGLFKLGEDGMSCKVIVGGSVHGSLAHISGTVDGETLKWEGEGEDGLAIRGKDDSGKVVAFIHEKEACARSEGGDDDDDDDGRHWVRNKRIRLVTEDGSGGDGQRKVVVFCQSNGMGEGHHSVVLRTIKEEHPMERAKTHKDARRERYEEDEEAHEEDGD